VLHKLERRAEQLELQSLLDGPNDPTNCVFHDPGRAGRTEAQDWAEMLLRMYLYYFERRGWDVSKWTGNTASRPGSRMSRCT
jgi:peptide chain release factor 2